jgi:hypothetical protein
VARGSLGLILAGAARPEAGFNHRWGAPPRRRASRAPSCPGCAVPSSLMDSTRRDAICKDLRQLEQALNASVGGPRGMGRQVDEVFIGEFEGIVPRSEEHGIRGVRAVEFGATYGDLLGAIDLQLAKMHCPPKRFQLTSDDVMAGV